MANENPRNRIRQNLTFCGYVPYELEGTNGGSALIIPDAARVVALFPPGGGESLTFVQPALLGRPAEARAYFSGGDWKNAGGDRTWIGPELDMHVADPEHPLESMFVPEAVDPGNWDVECNDGVVSLSNAGRVMITRAGIHCDFEMEKGVRMVPNPLRHEPAAQAALGAVEYVGYSQVVTLRLLSPMRDDVSVGIWNLICVPRGGHIVVPVRGRAEVRDFFESTGPDHLSQGEGYVHLRISGTERHKIGIRAAWLSGRAGYIRQVEPGTWTLLVRNFFVDPSGEYVDVPAATPGDLGWCFEAYNDTGALGGFGELEYHSPAIGGRSGLVSYEDKSQLWGFRGPQDAIRTIGGILLGEGTLPAAG